MRVAEFGSFGGPSDVSIVEREDPEPSSGEAVVGVEAASLNRHDLRVLRGESDYVDGSRLPFVPGLDLVGEVRAVGPGAAGVEPGDRVLLYPVGTCGRCRFCRDGPENRCRNRSLFHGALAEQAVVPAADLVGVPEGVESAAAAALPSAYLTAWRALERAGVAAGDRVLVPGATGGVGVAAVQLAGLRGARTVGTSRSPGKLDRLAAAGADRTLAVDGPDELSSAVAGGAPFDAVVNHLGGGYVDAGLDALHTGGRMVVCGGTAGFEATVDVARLYRSHAEVFGSSVGTKPDLERVVGFVAEDALSPAVDREFPLADAARAFRTLDDGDIVGKVVLRP
jgi:NADPH2:quinone reductase